MEKRNRHFKLTMNRSLCRIVAIAALLAGGALPARTFAAVDTIAAVRTISDLRAFPDPQANIGRIVYLVEYASGTGQGGGIFSIKAGACRDDGGVVIALQTAGYCASRQYAGHVSPSWFGVVADGKTLDTQAWSKITAWAATQAAMKHSAEIDMPDGQTRVNNGGNGYAVLFKNTPGISIMGQSASGFLCDDGEYICLGIVNSRHFRMDNVSLLGTNQSAPTVTLLAISQSPRSSIEYNLFAYGGTAVDLSSSYIMKFVGNDYSRDGRYIYTHGTGFADLWFAGETFASSQFGNDPLISVNTSVRFDNCYWETTSRKKLSLYIGAGAQHVMMTNPSIEDSGGIMDDTNADLIIVGGVMSDSWDDAGGYTLGGTSASVLDITNFAFSFRSKDGWRKAIKTSGVAHLENVRGAN
jgi:hypothetical protein